MRKVTIAAAVVLCWYATALAITCPVPVPALTNPQNPALSPYNADPTGVTNASSAFQSALNNGDLDVPTGTFLLNTLVNIGSHTIKCESGAILKTTNSINTGFTMFFSNGGTAGGVYGCQFRGGNYNVAPTLGTAGQQFIFHQSNSTNGTAGHMTFANNDFNGNGGNTGAIVIYADDAHQPPPNGDIVECNTAENSGHYFLQLTSGKNTVIQNNTLVDSNCCVESDDTGQQNTGNLITNNSSTFTNGTGYARSPGRGFATNTDYMTGGASCSGNPCNFSGNTVSYNSCQGTKTAGILINATGGTANQAVYIGNTVSGSCTFAGGPNQVGVATATPTAMPTATPTQSPTPTPTPRQTPTPGPTSTPSPTPTVIGHLPNVGPRTSAGPLWTDAQCAAAATGANYPESNPQNVNDGTGWNNNNQLWTTPSYFYNHAGNISLGTAADYAAVDGSYTGTTQEIVRWAACKWGADEDWAYAETQEEHSFRQDCAQLHGGSGCFGGGDCNNPDGDSGGETPNLSFLGFTVTDSSSNFVGPNAYTAGCGSPWASWGIIQSKVKNYEWHTWPMIALSTAWGEDYRWAKYRSCMNGDYANFFHNSADYANAVSNATSNPGGISSGAAQKYFGNETNLQYLGLGCMGAHFSGDWYGGDLSYIQTFMNILNPKSWPNGGLTGGPLPGGPPITPTPTNSPTQTATPTPTPAPSVPTLVSIGASTNTTSNSKATFSIAAPAGIATNYLIIVQIASYNGRCVAAACAPDASWHLIHADGATLGQYSASFWHLATGSGDGPWTFTNQGGNDWNSGIASAWSNVNAAEPVDPASSGTVWASGQTMQNVSVTPAHSSEMLVANWSAYLGTGGTIDAALTSDYAGCLGVSCGSINWYMMGGHVLAPASGVASAQYTGSSSNTLHPASGQIILIEANPVPTPVPTQTQTPGPTPSPSPTQSPSPTPTPTPVPPCIAVTAPSAGTTVNGNVAIQTTDNCPNKWFESLYVDGVHTGDFGIGAVQWQTGNFSNAGHSIVVTSQSQNPNSQQLGSSAPRSLTVNNPTPTPTQTPTPTPTPSPTPTGPTQTATQTPTQTPTFTPQPTNTVSPTPTLTPTPTMSPSPTPTPTDTPTAVPTDSPTPTAVPTNQPTATSSPSPTPTPMIQPASCVTITTPGSGQTLTGPAVPIQTADNCAGVQYETLYIDGLNLGNFAPGDAQINTTVFSNSAHTVQIVAHGKQHPGDLEAKKTLGTATIFVNLYNTNAHPISLTSTACESTMATCVRSSTYANTAFFEMGDQTKVPQIDGTQAYCYDCAVGANNVCAAGGSGSPAQRINGVWICGLINAGIVGSVPDPLSVNTLNAVGVSPALNGYTVNGVVDPRAYGAKLDGQICQDASATNAGAGGAIQVTSSCANFIGHTGEPAGLFTLLGPRLIDTTIASVQSANVATLASTVTAPVGTIGVVYGNDDGTLTNAFINSQPMNSTFTIKWPPNTLLITTVPINYNARNVVLTGAGGMVSQAQTTQPTAGGSVIVPIFQANPSLGAVVYIPDTWDARLENFTIVGDAKYPNIALVKTSKDTIANSIYPATYSYFDALTLGTQFGGTGVPMADNFEYGILAAKGNAQNDRGTVGRIAVNGGVFGVSFCGDAPTHPAGCQAVGWEVNRITCNRVNTCIDSSHGGVPNSVNQLEDLSSAVDFALGDSADLHAMHLTAEHDGTRNSLGIPWLASQAQPLYTTLSNGTCLLEVTTQGTTGLTPPSCPGLGLTVVDGTATETQVTNPPSVIATYLSTGGAGGGTLNISDSVWDLNGWAPPSGDIFGTNKAGFRFLGERFFLIGNGTNPTTVNPRIDLSVVGTSHVEFVCHDCTGVKAGYFNQSVSGGDTGQITHVDLTRSASNSGDSGAQINEYLVNGAPFKMAQQDVIGKGTVKGGPLTVNKLAAPVLFNLSCSGSGANTYLYKATAMSGAGETTGSAEITKSSCCTIGVSGCQVQGQVKPVIGAEQYNIYRTVAGGGTGTETLANFIAANVTTVNSLGVNSWIDGTVDASLGAAIPTQNTTGVAAIDTALQLGKLGAALGLAPGAGQCQMFVVAGTNAGTCKLQAICGTSATPVTVLDNVGAGC